MKPYERIENFKASFQPEQFDFRDTNHRSKEAGINDFGKDILLGRPIGNYSGVTIYRYPVNKNKIFKFLKYCTIKSQKRLIESGNKNWSIAILVPTKKMMQTVSAEFSDDSESFVTSDSSYCFH